MQKKKQSLNKSWMVNIGVRWDKNTNGNGMQEAIINTQALVNK